jgi:hypothetical protein
MTASVSHYIAVCVLLCPVACLCAMLPITRLKLGYYVVQVCPNRSAVRFKTQHSSVHVENKRVLVTVLFTL